MVKIFHIQKGDLCRITEKFNKQYIKVVCIHQQERQHPDYGDLLIAVSDPKRSYNSTSIETYNQVTMESGPFQIRYLEKV